EFYTLSQLSHPCVVEAYDYGVDERGAYYTMELLQGAELQSLAPLPFKYACRIARELCSVLSLLHSRRLLYRDLNPRNVHCKQDGATKLLDFGALASMGTCLQVVGTPAYCAPEAIDLQPLDARTDLYSLGATLYFALTGRHAFAAKSFAQLRTLWDSQPPRPNDIVQELPAALGALVMDLLKLDMSERPANASEVMEQLAVIEGKTVDEQLKVGQAYLCMPKLVGREHALAQAGSKLRQAARGQGGALLLSSGSGMGRSRVLGACLLEAKIQGALVLRAAAVDGEGDFHLVRALGLCLLELAPELAQRAAGLAGPALLQVLPELDAASKTQPNASELDRSRVLEAARALFTLAAHEKLAVIAVDDLHRVDEPSAACLALVAREASKHKLLIAATCESDAVVRAPVALKLYEDTALCISIGKLSTEQTEELVRSVFGSVPHVQLLAHELHAIAAGNPRDTLQLAQSLVDRGVVRYRSGGWSLPSNFEDAQLPSSMALATRRAFDALSLHTRALARLLSLAKDRALSFDECVSVHPQFTPQDLRAQLQELLRAQFVRYEADLVTIAHRSLHAALEQDMSQEELATQHQKLAEIFARRHDEQFRHAKHLLLAGESAAGLDALVAFAVAAQQRTDDPLEYGRLIQSLPVDWLDICNAALKLCVELHRPILDAFRIRLQLSGLLNVMGAPVSLGRDHLLVLMQQLYEDSGLDHYATLDSSLDPGTRLKLALEFAKQRYEAKPEALRGLEPLLAIRALVRVELWTVGIVALAFDHSLCAAVPSIAPLRSLSPAIGVMEQLVLAVAARIAGRQEYARSAYQQIIQRVSEPDHAALDPSYHRFLRFGVMYGLALLEAGMGLASSLTWATELETEPLHEVNALQVRLLYDLWQGRVDESDQARERIELRRIQSSARQMGDGTHLLWQVLAHAYSDDLTHLKQSTDALRAFALRHPGWLPVVDYATAEYHRIRGDMARAYEHLTRTMSVIAAGTHQIWPHAAAAHVNALCALGRVREAVERGTADLIAAEQAGLQAHANYIRMALAVALAQDAKQLEAIELADRVIESFVAMGSTGLNLILAYDARSRVAIHGSNRADYNRFAEQCAEQCERCGSALLRGKLNRLTRFGATRALSPPRRASGPMPVAALETELTVIFTDCEHANARAERALQLLLTRSGASVGCLFLVTEDGPRPVACLGDQHLRELTTAVADFIHHEREERGMVTASLTGESELQKESTRPGQLVLVLLSHQTPTGVAITGAAALIADDAFVHPGTLATRLSRMLEQFGDASTLLTV
ncbi:MAG TPA: AAA family ATPase, partial [Polyangiales bacterium]|nr:AAA family ATPase [Polyangiales bacterium]